MSEKLMRLKPYKTTMPYDTIQKIRTILYQHNIFLTEISIKSRISNTYAYRLDVADEGLENMGIGSNGKGMEPRYAVASAYGEFMERIQNMTFLHLFPEYYFYKPNNCESDYPDYNAFLDSCNAESSFLFAPDEKWMSVDDVLETNEDILMNMRLYRNLSKEDLRKVLSEFSFDHEMSCVPFYSVFEDKTVYLPYTIIKINTRSNGMCAGNSPKEALIQGLSEIYERYAQQKIMSENLKVPDIDIELFKETEIYKKLKDMEKNNFEIQILDFSCDMNLPVVALKIIDKDGGICIHPGADPSPITALERCLTEIYQGMPLLNQSKFKKEYYNPPDALNVTEQIEAFFENLRKALKDGTGMYPSNIHNNKRMPGFKGFSHPVTVSDDDDFQYMLNIAKRCGKNVYIRDNSYLGFPTYFIFIPGMSDMGFSAGPWSKNYLIAGHDLHTLRSLPIASLEDIKHLKEFIETDMKHKYVSFSVKDCFPPGIMNYLPKVVIDNTSMLLKGLELQIDFLEGKGNPVFTEENWPICYHCDQCSYQKECKYESFIKEFNSIRITYKNNVRLQNSDMFG